MSDNQQRSSTVSSSFLAAYAAYRRRDNHAEAFSATLSRVHDQLDFLRDAVCCLSIGTGSGRHELEFVDVLLPSLETFIAVEPDNESASELRDNLERSLPKVEYVISEVPVEKWEGPDRSVDVILVFHFMYYCVNPDWRRQFCQQLFNWTADGGAVAILMDRHDASPNGIHQLCRADNADRQIPSYDRTRMELVDAGFRMELEYEFHYSRDWSNPDPDLLRFVQLIRNVQQSNGLTGSSSSSNCSNGGGEGCNSNLDDIREAMSRMRIDQKTEGRTMFSVFKKVATSSDGCRTAPKSPVIQSLKL